MIAAGCTGPNQRVNEKIRVPVYAANPSAVSAPQKPLDEDALNIHGETRRSPTQERRLQPFGDLLEETPKEPLLETHFSKEKMLTAVIDEMPLDQLIHHVFSEMLGVNYVIDSQLKDLKRPITLKLSQKVSEAQLFDVMRGVLSQNGITVYGKDNIFYLVSGEKDRRITVGIGQKVEDIPVTSGQVLQVIPLKYADVEAIFSMMPRSQGMSVIPDLRENVFVVTGSREQVESVVRTVELLDRPAMKGRFVAMFTLSYWTAVDMADKIAELLTQEGIPVAKSPGQKGVQISVLEQRGGLIVFAAEKGWLDRAAFWVKQLDVPAEGEEKQFFLYIPKNCLASELGQTLSYIVQVTAPEKKEKPKSVIKRPSQSSMKTGMRGMGALSQARETVQKKDQEKETEKTATPEKQKLLMEDVSVTVDDKKNALIVYASQQKYRILENLLKRLDIMPVQVILEATVAEVTLKDDLKYGLEWFIENYYKNVVGNMGTYNKLQLGGNVFNYTVLSDYQKYRLLLNALATDNLVKILSSPRVTVRDGMTAQLVVGTEVPIITSEAASGSVITDGTTGILRSVQYRSTGVSLEVTPTVQAENIVTLEISQEVSEAQTNTTSNISSPLILNRTVSTEVVAADGQTVLLGGLIKENNSQTEVKIPILGDIPGLSYLFKTTSKSKDRTELVVMITPRIVRTTQQIDEMRDAMYSAFKYMETRPE